MEKIIQELEIFYKKNNIDHRFVGGVSFGGLLNENTTWEINMQKRIIYLHSPNLLNSQRPDGTLKDIDLIILSKPTKYKLPTTHYETSIEYAIFYPQKINSLFQFVTSIYVDNNNKPYLVFGNIQQEISWKSLEPWNVVVNKRTSYTVRNPIADYFAYQFRSPSGPKPKDVIKLKLLEKLKDDVIKEGRKNKLQYMAQEYYLPWKEFITKIQTSNDRNIQIKRSFMKLYWSTIGEYLAHGKGVTKYLSKFSNKFTGSN